MSLAWASDWVEPRGFEPLTSCLQIGPITRGNGHDLGEGHSVSDRECPPLTALNGPPMARLPRTRHPRPGNGHLVVLPGSTR